ncbi:MAG: hypothetical protein AUG48_09670 [Actinobacteria bacterium 13_1_20CM_3_68_9]|nr:MAG: hypothetical protein AUG48_09670 [Actinobacteria bacterium 13_1_20CM_3_68_9]
MASPNVELFEVGVDAYNARDPEAFVARCEPDCEWHPFLSSRVEGTPGYRGHDGIRAWFRDIDSMFTQMRADVREVRDLGDRVLGLGTIQARGRESGAEVSSPIGWLIEAPEGELRRGWAYASHEEALAAAGLEG